MKKAVITAGGRQYLVTEGEELSVELLKNVDKTVSFEPLLIIVDGEVNIGKPTVKGGKVLAEIVEQDIQSDKVTSIRYKAKKRVHKIRGHRQHQTKLKITSIA